MRLISVMVTIACLASCRRPDERVVFDALTLVTENASRSGSWQNGQRRLAIDCGGKRIATAVELPEVGAKAVAFIELERSTELWVIDRFTCEKRHALSDPRLRAEGLTWNGQGTRLFVELLGTGEHGVLDEAKVGFAVVTVGASLEVARVSGAWLPQHETPGLHHSSWSASGDAILLHAPGMLSVNPVPVALWSVKGGLVVQPSQDRPGDAELVLGWDGGVPIIRMCPLGRCS